MAVVGGGKWGGSGDIDLDQACIGLLQSLQDIDDDASDYGDESRCQSRLPSPMVYNSCMTRDIRASPLSSVASPLSSYRGSPAKRDQRASAASPISSVASPLSSFRGSPMPSRKGSRMQPRMMQSVSSPAVCRSGRGEKLRNVGQSVLGQQKKTPFGGGTPSSTFRSTFRDSKSSMGDSCSDWPKHTDAHEQNWQPYSQRSEVEPSSTNSSPSRSRTTSAAKESKDRQIWPSSGLRLQPRATGGVAAGGTGNGSPLEQLDAFKRLHERAIDELAQANRVQREQQEEIRDLKAKVKKKGRGSDDDELADMQVQLSRARKERDQLKSDLQLVRDQTGPALSQLRDQCSSQQEELRDLQEELRIAHDQKSSEDDLLHKLQEELRVAKLALVENAKQDHQGKYNRSTLAAVQEESREGSCASEEQALDENQEKAVLQKAVFHYGDFVSELVESSARPVLEDTLDMNGADLLGMGRYGYIMSCKSKQSGDSVVLKLQNVRRADAAVRQWGHAKEVPKCAHIVELSELFMHSDSAHRVQELVLDNVNRAHGGNVPMQGAPKWFPSTYLCMVSEFMDSGSLSSLMEKKLLTLEGICAVSRQVAAGLAFMHERNRNHNEIRPENILLKRSREGGVLQVKLADLGMAERSGDHLQDRELLAYTMWCMVVDKDFSRCPPKEARSEAMAEFQKSPLFGSRATGRGRALIESVGGLWNDRLAMPQVASKVEFADCEVREPEASDARRQLAVCATLEVTERAKASWEKFRHTWHAPRGATDLRHIDADQMATLDEGSITVRDSRDQ